MKTNEQIPSSGSNSVLGLVGILLVIALGSSVVHSTKSATIVPKHVATR